MRCAEACEFCATSDLKEQDVKMMATCAQINRECTSVCWTPASLMSMTAGLESSSATCAPTFARLVPGSAKGIG